MYIKSSPVMLGTRSKNLDLIRWMNHGHKNTVEKLRRVISNGCYLSDMALGKINICDTVARDIEKELQLPEGWLDRDNISVITNMIEDDYRLFKSY